MCAVFNPQETKVPEREYIGFSKPIEQPHFISGSAETIKGAGNVLQGAIHSADDIVKAFIRDDTRTTLEKERGQFTEGLVAKDAQVRLQAAAGGNVGDTNSEGGSGFPSAEDHTDFSSQSNNSLVEPAKSANAPQDIKNFPQNVGMLDSARKSGKISETDFYGRVTSLVKDIRSRYPVGYSDYIDHQVHTILGVNPANAYVRSLLGDINSFASSDKSQINYVAHQLVQTKDEGAIAAAMDVMSGKRTIAQGLAVLAQVQKPFAAKAQMEAAKAIAEADKVIAAQDAERHWSTVAASEGAQFERKLHAYLANNPFFNDLPRTKDPTTGAMIVDWSKMNTDQAQQASTWAHAEANRVRASWDVEAGRPDKNGNSATSLLGDKFKILTERGLGPYIYFGDSIHDPKSGLATLPARLLKAKEDTANLAISRIPGFGDALLYAKFLKDTGGPDVAKVFLETYPNFYSNAQNHALIGIAATLDPNSKTVPMDIFRAAVDDKIPDAPAVKNFYKKFNEAVANGYLNPGLSDHIRATIGDKIFRQENWKYLSLVKDDKMNRHDMFDALTSKPMVETTKQLSINNPPLARKMIEWTKQSFANELFQQDISRLSEMGKYKGLRVGWEELGEGPDKGQLRIRIAAGKERPTGFGSKETGQLGGEVSEGMMLRDATDLETRLNVGLRGLQNVAKGLGFNAAEFVVSTMQKAGWDTQTPDTSKMPGQLIEALRKHTEQGADKPKTLPNLKGQ